MSRDLCALGSEPMGSGTAAGTCFVFTIVPHDSHASSRFGAPRDGACKGDCEQQASKVMDYVDEWG